ncbi:alpha/beta fold hydrolase [Paracraurococcus lichenis]|uniref:Alpha/beta hydrolase n=1 Tax=Paracraurococcus lichenis TaxID=3064888 RepID=A0ABT9DVY7_9PROT|nr:alpha/beta hydrolase [Paracraurococcus sp. LOR1-02]MDO9708064.1 alpha/beta hydrolase [Paracraurococcus sp. LOR1-02]
MHRRPLLQLAAASPAAVQPPGLLAARGRTYVLVHGSFTGGWLWAPVAERLRARGHCVYTPTQTGLGERRHLLTRGITLDTFVTDVTSLIETEELEDVVLVGHSFGGIPITGVADRIPGRIRHLVYLDALVIEGGKSFSDSYPPEVVAERRRAAEERGGGLAVPPPPLAGLGALGIPPGPLADWVHRHMAAQPLGSYETPLRLENPFGNGRPKTYVFANSPPFPALASMRDWVRRQPGWTWVEIAAGHFAPITAPAEVTALLDGIA